jgi:LysR family glycine cleavage system transcriptional activator
MGDALPSLDALRVLAACVRYHSFSRAAAELHITPAAVSHRIRTLEAQLGVRLFRRHGPTLITTDRAKALGQRVEHALSLVRVAIDHCRRIKHPLRVTCAPTFAARWLVPRLASYNTLPGADAFVLDATQAMLPSGTFDVAIRSGVGPWPGYYAARLLTEQGTPMLSPGLVPRATRLTVRRLLQLPLIPDPRWQQWFALAGVPEAKPRFISTRFPNYELEAQAAVQGAGVALLSPRLFTELTTQGSLIAPFRWVVEGPESYWLLATSDSRESHFARWIKSQFGYEPSRDASGNVIGIYASGFVKP